MNILLLLVPAALLLGLAGLIAFFWALRSGQFEDLDGAAERILHDDEDEEAKDEGDRLREHKPADTKRTGQ